MPPHRSQPRGTMTIVGGMWPTEAAFVLPRNRLESSLRNDLSLWNELVTLGVLVVHQLPVVLV